MANLWGNSVVPEGGVISVFLTIAAFELLSRERS